MTQQESLTVIEFKSLISMTAMNVGYVIAKHPFQWYCYGLWIRRGNIGKMVLDHIIDLKKQI